jgi:hypothetical protein
MSSYLDEHYSNFNVALAMADRQDAEMRASRARKARDDADAELREAEVEAETIQRTIDAYNAWRASRELDELPADQPRVGQPAVIQHNGTSLTSRASILELIEGGPDEREWTIPSVAEALGLGEEAHHAIGVSLSRMTRIWNGESPKLARRRRGVYTKLPSETVPAGTGEDREVSVEDDGSQGGPGQAAAFNLMG